MIDAPALLSTLQAHLPKLEDDLRQRADPAKHREGSLEHTTATELDRALRAEHRAAKEAERTAESFAAWREEQITQGAVAWTLACVFVRFLEDNELLDPPVEGGRGNRDPLDHAPWLGGPTGASPKGEAPADGPSAPNRLARATEQRRAYFTRHPEHTERDYLLFVFERLRALPGMGDLLGEHNPLWRLQPSGDGAKALLEIFRRTDPATGVLLFDFTDRGDAADPDRPGWSTRFLGDLYQDLSAAARKRYALLQTPEFVEEFLLERTLEPAMRRFGHESVRLLDPACGSGHFLLGAFRRLAQAHRAARPDASAAALAQDALEQVRGVDLNPFAVAIARFRLLIEALRFAGTRRLASAPELRLLVATGDSLLHGPSFRSKSSHGLQLELGEIRPVAHHFQSEDEELLREILGEQHHVVIGNPPYITGKDARLRDAYRSRFPSCHGKFSLAVPFTERFFQLARFGGDVEGGSEGKEPSLPVADAGFVAMITANSFMKREFGKKLIEDFFGTIDLTHVIDTSGAYIPGHGTPTVILLGRHRAPQGDAVRAVLGIRGEPTTPADPAQGVVWQSIVEGVDEPGFENEWVSVADRELEVITSHPWSLQGGAAPDVLAQIDARCSNVLGKIADSIGITSFTLEDDLFLLDKAAARRRCVSKTARPMVVGEELRDWDHVAGEFAVFPYNEDLEILDELPEPVQRYLWRGRTGLSNNKMFGGKTKIEAGLKWYEYGRLTASKLRTPLSITFAEVATHNHFVLDRGGKVFKRTAPVIKLPADASLEDHFGLLGVLNSSTADFWSRQIFYPKGGDKVGTKGARLSKAPWQDRLQRGGTQLANFPLPTRRPTVRSSQLDTLATALQSHLPASLTTTAGPQGNGLDADTLAAHQAEADELRALLVFLQEELDWWCYAAYGLLPAGVAPSDVLYVPEALSGGDGVVASDLDQLGALDGAWWTLPLLDRDDPAQPTVDSPTLDPLPLELGERAFEIALAQQVAAGTARTAWFERHRSTPRETLPAHWPARYRAVVARRLELLGARAEVDAGPSEGAEGTAATESTAAPESTAGTLAIEGSGGAEGRESGVDREGVAPTEATAHREGAAPAAAVVSSAQTTPGPPPRSRPRNRGDRFLRLLERPEHKRRWAHDPWGKQQAQALRAWLVERLEDRDLWPAPTERSAMPRIRSAAELTDYLLAGGGLPEPQGQARAAAFRRVAALFAGRADVDLEQLTERLLTEESVPACARLRYKPSGLRKHAQWLEVWELQRKEDAIAARAELPTNDPDHLSPDQAEELRRTEVGTIPVPPKYTSGDFLAGAWKHRGKLDVPKEAFVSFPGSERALDGSPRFAWAGWDHHQLTRALIAEIQRQAEEGAGPDARAPLLLALQEQLPWVAQWHDETNPTTGRKLSESYQTFVEAQTRALGWTLDELEAWQPGKKGKKAKAAKKNNA